MILCMRNSFNHFPYAPYMEYLPTFGLFFMVNVGKYLVHPTHVPLYYSFLFCFGKFDFSNFPIEDSRHISLLSPE